MSGLDPNVVLGLFTWDDDAKYHHREIDIELIRQSPMGPHHAQYVVQPANTPGHRHRFLHPRSAASSAHSFTWDPDFVSFASSTTGTFSFTPG